MEELRVQVPDMSCGHCSATIKNAVGALEGVKSVEADPDTKRVRVDAESSVDDEKIVKAIPPLPCLAIS